MKRNDAALGGAAPVNGKFGRGSAATPSYHPPSGTATSPIDLPVIVAEWPRRRDGMEFVRVAIEEWQGGPLIAVRVWFIARNHDRRPTKNGITLGVRHLPRLAKAFADAERIAREQGLIADDRGAA
jgi:hypothetical protein